MIRRTAFATLMALAPVSIFLLLFPALASSRATHPSRNTETPRMFCVGNGVGDGSSKLYRVDAYSTAPKAILLGDTKQLLRDIAITPSGAAYAITADTLYKMDLTNGATTWVGSLGVSGQNSLEAASDGRLLSWGTDDSKIYSIDPQTAVATLLVDAKIFSGGDIAMAPNSCDLYGTTLDNRLIKINLSTLALKEVGPLKTGDKMPGLGFAPDGTLFGTQGNDSNGLARVYKIDLRTGEARLVGDIAGAHDKYGNYGMAISR